MSEIVVDGVVYVPKDQACPYGPLVHEQCVRAAGQLGALCQECGARAAITDMVSIVTLEDGTPVRSAYRCQRC